MKDVEVSNSADVFRLGEVLGSRRALSAIAGRCSAAEAEHMRQIRDEKLFLAKASNWNEFCPKFLGMSKTHANRLIRLLEEFGPEYFDLAQLTRITPEQYRVLAPAVRDHTIEWKGEAIALLPENSDKVASAVEGLRKELAHAAKPARPRKQRLTTLERNGDSLVAEFKELAEVVPALETDAELRQIRARILQRLSSIRM